MGIPKYHKWLTERYPQAFTERPSESAEHVYVDVNALLHEVMRHSNTEEQFLKELFVKFDLLFTKVAPTCSLFLAVDGPASFAKCLTQRQRRREHSAKDKRGGRKGAGREPQLSNNMLTPGVPFMTRLTSSLEQYALSRMNAGRQLARCTSVTISGALSIGEGEHKIVSQVLRRVAAGAAEETHVIISGDADLFLLSLIQMATRRVRVVSLQQPSQQPGQKRARPGKAMLTIWNTEALAQCLIAEVPEAAPGDEAEAALRRDFALLSLLSGNDYLPALRCGFSPKQLWERYLQLRRESFPQEPLVQARTPDERLPLSHSEAGWASSVGDWGSAFAAEAYSEFMWNVALLLELLGACGETADGQIGEDQTEGVRRYLTGLLWVLEMYHHGYCGDFSFVFDKKLHPYANAGLIVRCLAEEEDGAPPLAPPRSELSPLRPLTCAICLLPARDAERLLCPVAPELRPMFTDRHPLLGSVNAMEGNSAIASGRSKAAELQQRLAEVRAAGLDDTQVKAELTRVSGQIHAMKQSCSDIDVVPLREVDEEVQKRCASRRPRELNFEQDVTFVRQQGHPSRPNERVPKNLLAPERVAGEFPVTHYGEEAELGEEPGEEALDEEAGEPSPLPGEDGDAGFPEEWAEEGEAGQEGLLEEEEPPLEEEEPLQEEPQEEQDEALIEDVGEEVLVEEEEEGGEEAEGAESHEAQAFEEDEEEFGPTAEEPGQEPEEPAPEELDVEVEEEEAPREPPAKRSRFEVFPRLRLQQPGVASSRPPGPAQLGAAMPQKLAAFLRSSGGCVPLGRVASVFIGVKKAQLEPHFRLYPHPQGHGEMWVCLPGVNPPLSAVAQPRAKAVARGAVAGHGQLPGMRPARPPLRPQGARAAARPVGPAAPLSNAELAQQLQSTIPQLMAAMNQVAQAAARARCSRPPATAVRPPQVRPKGAGARQEPLRITLRGQAPPPRSAGPLAGAAGQT